MLNTAIAAKRTKPIWIVFDLVLKQWNWEKRLQTSVKRPIFCAAFCSSLPLGTPRFSWFWQHTFELRPFGKQTCHFLRFYIWKIDFISKSVDLSQPHKSRCNRPADPSSDDERLSLQKWISQKVRMDMQFLKATTCRFLALQVVTVQKWEWPNLMYRLIWTVLTTSLWSKVVINFLNKHYSPVARQSEICRKEGSFIWINAIIKLICQTTLKSNSACTNVLSRVPMTRVHSLRRRVWPIPRIRAFR